MSYDNNSIIRQSESNKSRIRSEFIFPGGNMFDGEISSDDLKKKRQPVPGNVRYSLGQR